MSRYSKKHYEELANIIKDSRWESNGVSHIDGTMLLNEIIRMFEFDNPNFDRERFIEACK